MNMHTLLTSSPVEPIYTKPQRPESMTTTRKPPPPRLALRLPPAIWAKELLRRAPAVQPSSMRGVPASWEI